MLHETVTVSLDRGLIFKMRMASGSLSTVPSAKMPPLATQVSRLWTWKAEFAVRWRFLEKKD